MTNLPIGQITQLTESSQTPRSMAFQTVLPQLKQENANLRDLLNASMAENAALLKQIADMQEALNIENEKLARMIDSSAQSRLENMTEAYQEAKKHVEELATALRQLIAKINTYAAIADKQFGQEKIVNVERVYALTDLLNGRNEAMKVLEVAPGDVAVYSIYTDPLIVGVAADLDCTVDELMQYAADSVGMPTEVQTIEGCHSAGLHNCYGDLWTCKGCGHTFCCAEGSDNMPELCNECWWKAQGEAK